MSLRSLDWETDKIVGESPSNELDCSPRWLVFPATTDYNKPCYTEFTIKNLDPFPVAWCIKSKPREYIMCVSLNYGVLKPGQERVVKVYLLPVSEWPRDGSNYYNKIIQLCVQNLRVPDAVMNAPSKQQWRTAREVFKYTQEMNPNQRMYTKISMVLKSDEKTKLY